MGKRKILVIDDEADLLTLVKARLDKAGFETLIASGGREGIEDALRFKPDMILLDIMMPDINGFQVLKELKLKEETKDIPVVAFTALAEEDNIRRAKNLGAVDYVVKPFEFDHLLTTVRRYLI